MIIISDYHITFNSAKNYYVVVNHIQPICPICSNKLIVRDSKKRKVLKANGNTAIIALRRLYCTNCNKMNTELPDIIEPFKRYLKAVINGVQNGTIDYCAADDRTIRRWKTDTPETPLNQNK